ncbi:tRNA (adenosine(37)-N6)-threonylcarbamoyltransferase complex dimerization subunit type 1 TsaB [Sphaerotilus montanus]|uniref:tRNA threonylcarbamoyladenosine biosynthesis protein TsaB n=1 Tax=Sphaerotilus montanus TaxID=522889 RepID=A0A7Y9QXV0_9BURK|nr:tRNA (adenosine(37)-N6)-threonylcarbamoyltransferase complex dimerization subunit type 1 TsaB [Sphaerotilus montanus]NYG32926.1 tRNA threonylcarbamoyladenosine biosynthesis protein TsaB [Sphaerotilus montanus]NZD56190.1 tRNA (adenosine(37)-N6)-threonylcarbamoyltransferase complex dimerization subunit type 1 TsaB [Sphaerotilus montanus]
MSASRSAPRLLALDTATDTVHLALVQGDAVQVRALPGGAQSSAALLPAIRDLLAHGGLALRDLDAIAFGHGPGAFTGLRTACAVAQGLAVGAERPLLALDTLAALAESARQQGETAEAVWSVLDARMGEVYAARWCRGADGGWTADVPVALYSPAALAEAIAQAPAPLAGNALTVQAEVLGPLAARLVLASWPAAVPGGAALAVLARAAQARGAWIDPALALPLYVRDKVAQTTAEREALRATAATVAAAGAA